MREFRYQNGLRKFLCKIGLHYMCYSFILNALICYCRKNYLWMEQIGDWEKWEPR